MRWRRGVLGVGVALVMAMTSQSWAAMGPLRVDAGRGGYFVDGAGRPVYLTGSHNWNSLQDGVDPQPRRLSFDRYLAFLAEHHHNFIRLWTDEMLGADGERNTRLEVRPLPYPRTGPGAAVDGRPKLDLPRFDPAYFARLRERVSAARARGIYVSVMLFNGWDLQFASVPWRAHPFHAENNVNGIEGDVNGDGRGYEIETLDKIPPPILALQEAYVRQVVDTVNDLDNVLYEIANEAGGFSTAWQYHLIEYIKRYEATKPYQHPVGMTFQYAGGSNAALFASPADWISPNSTSAENYESDPPVATRGKVVLTDTDHLCGICLDWVWVWKSFTRGLNPIYMDPLDRDAAHERARRAMGQTRTYAERMNLRAITAQPALASSRYCLANASATDAEYLVFVVPGNASVSVDLSATPGELSVEWLDPATGVARNAGITTGGAKREFSVPFRGGGVLYLKSRPER